MRLAEILIEAGILDLSQYERLMAENPRSSSPPGFATLLIDSGAASPSEVSNAISEAYAIDFMRRIEADCIDSELVNSVPISWARKHCVLPVRLDGEIAMLTPNVECDEEEKYLSLLLHSEVMPVLAPEEEIRSAIDTCYVSREAGHDDIIGDMQGADEVDGQASSESDTDLLSTIENAPVTQLVNLILLEAVKANASDIHIEPYEERLQVRYRIDGVLYEQPAPPKRLQSALVSRLKVMARLDIAEKRLPQDGMTKVSAGDREIDIRVSTVPVAEGERLVLRILSRQSVLMPMEGLGMAPSLLAVVRDLLEEPQGIILVTGPTGSGKTTTLYSGLQELDTSRLNIITIEDPIEYQLERISQIQVKPRIGLTFADGLRHILRQDPDVILVGEIRDAETAEIAIRSSLTGHLVLSTLHTNDAVSTPLRIIDMGIKPYLLSESLRAVLAQRLVRRLCPECRLQADWGAQQLKLLPEGLATPSDGDNHYTPVGCPQCRDGYKGRLGIFESLIMNDQIKQAVRNEADLRELSRIAEACSMDTLWNDGLRKVGSGSTSVDELSRVLGRASLQ